MTDQNSPVAAAKQRAANIPAEQESALNVNQESAIRQLANDLHRLNHSVMQAVESGVSVELIRSARHHSGSGNWGDMLVPVIVSR